MLDPFQGIYRAKPEDGRNRAPSSPAQRAIRGLHVIGHNFHRIKAAAEIKAEQERITGPNGERL